MLSENLRTMRDMVPVADYARYVRTIKVTNILNLLMNYIEDVEPFLKSSIKPTLRSFGNKLYIDGSRLELLYASTYIRDNPDQEYSVQEFESSVIANQRFESIFGYSVDDFPVDLPPEPVFESSESWLGHEELLTEAVDWQVSNISATVKNFIREYDPKKIEKTILLIGHSGVAKSAIVKSAITSLGDSNGWGYRLIDIRAAFLDKCDLLGFVATEEFEGSSVWSDSPKFEFLTCSTPFVEQCRDFITTTEETPENKVLIDKIKFYAKTPVLFLDEISRSPKYIMNQLMVIINQHKLNNYDISIAPKICAANIPIDLNVPGEMTDEQKDLVIYLGKKLTDKAVRDRFITLPVSGKDESVYISVGNYLLREHGAGVDPKVKKVFKKFQKMGLLHDVSKIDENGKFPTFRGWEDFLKYMTYIKETGDTPLFSVVEGLLGTDIAKQVTDDLGGFDLSESTDNFIEQIMASGLPMILLGRMGIGKTIKINRAIEKMGAIKFDVDLSAHDRTTISGYPELIPFAQRLVGPEIYEAFSTMSETEKEGSTFKAFEEILNKTEGIPKQTTHFVPNIDIVKQIKKAAESGKRVVLMFDEISRCSGLVQSAVFEAISDARFLGKSLEGIDYSVVAAGNWIPSAEENEYDLTEPIDTATLHRFASKIIKDVNKEDLDSWRTFLKNERPVAFEIFKDIGDKRLMEMLNDTVASEEEQERDLARPSLSMRTLPSLEETILRNDYLINYFGVGNELTVDKLDELELVFKDPNYIMKKNPAPIIIDIPHLRDLYGLKEDESIPMDDYLSKTIELMRTVSEDIFIELEAFHNVTEEQFFDGIIGEVEGEIPPDFLPEVKMAVKNIYVNRTRIKVGVSSTLPSLEIEDEVELESVFNRLLSKFEPEDQVEGIESCMMDFIKDAAEPVNTSHIKKLLRVVNKILPIEKVDVVDFCKQLQNYQDKIVFDEYIDEKIPLKSILGGAFGNYESVLKESISFIQHSSKKFYVGRVYLSYEKAILDHYSVVSVDSSDKEYPVIFDPSFWKVEVVKKGKTFDYVYVYIFGIFKIMVTCKVINSVSTSETIPIVPDNILADSKLILHDDVQMLRGALKTLEIYQGSSIDEIPSDIIDPGKAMTLINAATKVSLSKINVEDLGAHYKKFFKILWSKVDSCFTN